MACSNTRIVSHKETIPVAFPTAAIKEVGLRGELTPGATSTPMIGDAGYKMMGTPAASPGGPVELQLFFEACDSEDGSGLQGSLVRVPS